MNRRVVLEKMLKNLSKMQSFVFLDETSGFVTFQHLSMSKTPCQISEEFLEWLSRKSLPPNQQFEV